MARAKKSASKAAAKTAGAKDKAKAKAAKKAKAKAAPKAVKKAVKKAAKKAAPKAIKKAVKKAAKKAAPKAIKKAVKKAVKTAAKKAAPKSKAAKKPSARKIKKLAPTPELFAPLTEGERAETLRILLEDTRLSSMAKVGRYRVIAVEPLAFKPGHELAAQRIARVVIYDYSADRCVESNVDLDAAEVKFLSVNKSQPMLSTDEEVIAMQIALGNEGVRGHLALGEEPQAAMHYWSNKPTDISHSRRSAAVLFGSKNERPSFVAVVDLIDGLVIEIVPAGLW